MKPRLVIAHRVNSLGKLLSVSNRFGVEVDVRTSGSDIILNHDPFLSGCKLQDYLVNYNHPFIIFNIKEAGIEQAVINMAREQGVNDYFLLDVEFPYLYKASRQGVRNIAIRYSEDESLETVLKYKGLVDWVWIDTISCLPLNVEIARQLRGFKTCLVCPERWGRPQSILDYKSKLNDIGMSIDAVMTDVKYAELWQE